MERTLKDLSVEGVKTRKKPNKHIVFAVKVTWSDGQVNVVSRRYCEFFELMEKLNETFPVEAGDDHYKRILPSLQAKKTFLRNTSAMKQLERITHFTKELVHLPEHISQCHIVRTFFTPTETDIESTRKISVKKPKTKTRNWRRKSTAKKVLSISGPMSLEQYRVIADVRNERKRGLHLKEGQIVEVIEKLETGWWLVTAEGEQGWVPATYLSNENDPEETMTTIKHQPGQGECYVTSTSYTATFKDELSFDIGVHVQVIEKNLDGWWRAIYNGCEGLVPAAYLKKVGDKPKQGNKPPPARKITILSQKNSVTSQDEMNIETLAKLRESTYESPEEKEQIFPKKIPSRAEPKKVHLELKTSVDGGWVPQVIPATQPPEKERRLSQDKGFSLLRGFGNLRKSRRDEESDDKTAQGDKNPLNVDLPQRSKSTASDLKSLKKSRLNVVGLKGFGNARKSGQDGESDEKKTAKGDKNLLNVHLPQRSKSAASDLKSFKKSRPNVVRKKEKALTPVNAKQIPRRRSMVDFEELVLNSSAGKNEKAIQQGKAKSLDRKVKFYQKWSSSEEDIFHDLPWKNENVKNEYSGVPPYNTRSSSEFYKDEFSPSRSSLSPKQQEIKKLGGSKIQDDDQTEQETCTLFEDAPCNESPAFVVTPPTPQSIRKQKMSDAPKKKLQREKSLSCPDLASSFKPVEDDALDGLEDDDDPFLDEDYDSSDEDFCTLEDLMNEERESKGSGFYDEDLPNKRNESFDSGMESSSPPSTPEMIKIPSKSEASNTYVAIADYKGSKEGGEVDLFEGQQVRVLQKTAGGWWLVEDDAEQKGWAPSNFLESLEQTFCYVGDGMQSEGVCKENERNVIQLPNGEELQVVDTDKDGHFMLVRVPSKFAWISKSLVFEKNDQPQCKI